ncbi:MAG: class I SAM-dependent methyltransferase [Rhodospirillaceae bacterium]
MELAQAAEILARYRQAPLLDTIAADDLMWRGDRPWYFAIGESALVNILKMLAAGRLSAVGEILDLPCGHGRVARHLRAAFPEARITFCDLNPAAVAFCSRHIGGEGMLSSPDLTSLRFGRRFDLIWVGSLLPHVDIARIRSWLHFLAAQLNEDGILIATFHGAWSIMMHRLFPMIDEERWACILSDYEATGFGYRPYRDGMDYPYGINLGKPALMVDIAGEIDGVRLLGYHERAWDNHQDVMALARTCRLEPWPR